MASASGFWRRDSERLTVADIVPLTGRKRTGNPGKLGTGAAERLGAGIYSTLDHPDLLGPRFGQ